MSRLDVVQVMEQGLVLFVVVVDVALKIKGILP